MKTQRKTGRKLKKNSSIPKGKNIINKHLLQTEGNFEMKKKIGLSNRNFRDKPQEQNTSDRTENLAN